MNIKLNEDISSPGLNHSYMWQDNRTNRTRNGITHCFSVQPPRAPRSSGNSPRKSGLARKLRSAIGTHDGDDADKRASWSTASEAPQRPPEKKPSGDQVLMNIVTTEPQEEKCNRLKAKHEKQFNELFEELQYLRDKISHPVVSKLKVRMSRALHLNTLEPSKYI